MPELVWEGKYKDGKKVAPVRIALPLQTIETVNESAQEWQRSLDLFASGREPDWRNRLIWGDEKYVLPDRFILRAHPISTEGCAPTFSSNLRDRTLEISYTAGKR